jgi:hypothetical protein
MAEHGAGRVQSDGGAHSPLSAAPAAAVSVYYNLYHADYLKVS